MNHFIPISIGLWVSLCLPNFALASPPQTQHSTNLTQTDRPDLSKLKARLQARDWQAADAETRRILETWVHPDGNIYATPVVNNIPLDTLQTLDRLWSQASDGRFGFSAQLQIWKAASEEHPNDSKAAVRAFGDRVGWTRPLQDDINFTAPDWLTERELNYSPDAPAGHLPWIGIDWERIESLLNEPGCGSCTIDVLYLQGERFYRYLPPLLARVEMVVCNNLT
jgi:hypothetical protein